ncbi:MAG: hypothetical protein E6X17_00240 [Sporomusaceae bacterium]|nr:hypothetical protein [Sporomusaceae bacterium]
MFLFALPVSILTERLFPERAGDTDPRGRVAAKAACLLTAEAYACASVSDYPAKSTWNIVPLAQFGYNELVRPVTPDGFCFLFLKRFRRRRPAAAAMGRLLELEMPLFYYCIVGLPPLSQRRTDSSAFVLTNSTSLSVRTLSDRRKPNFLKAGTVSVFFNI